MYQGGDELGRQRYADEEKPGTENWMIYLNRRGPILLKFGSRVITSTIYVLRLFSLLGTS